MSGTENGRRRGGPKESPHPLHIAYEGGPRKKKKVQWVDKEGGRGGKVGEVKTLTVKKNEKLNVYSVERISGTRLATRAMMMAVAPEGFFSSPLRK